MTVPDKDNLIPYKELYDAYVEYCKLNCIDCKSSDTFSKSAIIKELPNVRGKVRYKKGIALKTY